MKKLLSRLLTLLFLTCFSSALFADKYPKSHKHDSFRCCPVNAHAGKRAKARTTHIRKKIITPKTTHTPSESYSGSGGGSTSGTAAQQPQPKEQPKQEAQENIQSAGRDTDSYIPQRNDNPGSERNVDAQQQEVPINKAPVSAPGNRNGAANTTNAPVEVNDINVDKGSIQVIDNASTAPKRAQNRVISKAPPGRVAGKINTSK